jgi:hypothetical protein
MRQQLYLDVSMSEGGGGSKPDGTPTPFIDLNIAIERLSGYPRWGLVLDPEGSRRWVIQSALRDAFGWDGTKDPEPHHIDRLRHLAVEMEYLPPWGVHRVVVLDKHDECRMPHPGGD